MAALALVAVPSPLGVADAAAAKKKPRVKLPTSKGKRWKLVRSSEFSDPGKTFKAWLTQRDDWIKGGIPYSNLEGPHYAASNVAVGNGALQLRLDRQTAAQANARYGMAFKYGYLESRVMVPKCSGCWPAFWLLPREGRWPPEIDVFEYANSAAMPWPYSGLHWPSSTPGRVEDNLSKVLSKAHSGDYTGRWQTYGMLWGPKRIYMYFNGRLGAKFTHRTGIPRQKMYPIFQLAVGAGFPIAAGSTMQVDYVRLWQQRRRG